MLTACVIISFYRSTTCLFSIHAEVSIHIENIIAYIFYPFAISFPNYTCRKYNGVYFLSHRYINIISVIILTRYKRMFISMVQLIILYACNFDQEEKDFFEYLIIKRCA